MRLVALISVPVTVGSLLLAPRTLEFLYGRSFLPALLTYQLLILIIPVRMVGNTISLCLAATDRQKARTIAVAVTAAANVGLNIYFIQRWSYLGAAMTSVICETGLLIVYAIILRKVTGPSELLRSNAWPLLAAVPMAVVILLTSHLPFLASAVSAVLAYAAAVAALALMRATGDNRRRPGRALAALVEPPR
jgi:O-antigen/teichoic acid export membrane protein